MQSEHIFWMCICVVSLIVVTYLLLRPRLKYTIDGKYFYTYLEAKRYYRNQDMRGRQKMMINIYRYDNDELIQRMRCSDYFRE
jgi:hypothetical protein